MTEIKKLITIWSQILPHVFNGQRCYVCFSCCDYLTVNDVDNSRSSEMKLCGLQTALEPLHPTGELRINFVSDDIHVIGANGFRLSYYQVKGT